MGEFVTWEGLATMGTATAFVTLAVQYMKAPLDRIWKIPTRLLVYLMSFLVLLAATAVTTGLTWQSAGLVAINALMVALASMGAYEATFHMGEKKQ